MSRVLDYSVLDVFAEQPLAGNPLAVFHDASSLTAEEMLALARETNLSETTFILPGDPAVEGQEGVRVRIFTVEGELPFAGHPTLGTATWLHLNHPTLRGADTLKLRLDAGLIPVRFHPQPGRPGVFATMRQNDPVFGPTFTPAEVADIIGVPVDDLLPGHNPQVVSTANPCCIVVLRSVDALSSLAIPQQKAVPWLLERGIRWFYCIAPTGSIGAQQPAWQARMQWQGGEDPATGSAAGPCIAWLVSKGLARPDTETLILQGAEIARPSLISARAFLSGTKVSEIHVSGRTIPVASGRFFLP